MASAASAPATRPAPRARQPWARQPWARQPWKLIAAKRRSGGGLRDGRRPNAQATDAPGIDVEDLELHARRMAHHLAALRDAAEQREDQAAHRVDLAALVLRQDVADLLFEQLDRGAAVDVDRAVGAARHG